MAEEPDFEKMKHFPVWKEKYDKLGVTPRELYMRQNGLCWLVAEVDPDNNVELYCTDGEDKARTCQMLNPTLECAQCMAGFATKVVKDAVSEDK